MNQLCGKHTEKCCWFPKCIAGGRPGQKAAFYCTWTVAQPPWPRRLVGSQLQAVFSGYGMVTGRTFAPAIPCVPRGSANPHTRRSHCREPGWGAGACVEANQELGNRNQRQAAVPRAPGEEVGRLTRAAGRGRGDHGFQS